MSELQKLINELCPNGVEYRNLENCCIILDNKRKPITKGARENGKYPYYGANGIQDYVSGYIFDGIFILIGEDGSVVTENGNPVVNWAEGKIWVNNHAHIVKEKEGILLRYLYHYLQIINIKSLIHGNIPKLTGKDFKALQIPIPPIEVQAEIVRILDSFTEYTNLLEQELVLRQKQYEYYRDKLLTFGDDVYCVKLENICKIGDGLHSTPKYTDDGNYYFINGNNLNNGYITFDNKTKKVDVSEYNKHKIHFSNNTIFMSINGTIGKMALYNNEPIILGKSVAYFISNPDLINNKFLYYYLQTNMAKNYYELSLTGSTILNLGLNSLRNFKIPIPPLSEQQRIVSILDKFDKLCNDISEGLPAEINARQKQYEYYRDKIFKLM